MNRLRTHLLSDVYSELQGVHSAVHGCKLKQALLESSRESSTTPGPGKPPSLPRPSGWEKGESCLASCQQQQAAEIKELKIRGNDFSP